MTKLKFINFGFPQNITVEEDIANLKKLEARDFSNKNVHIKLTLDKQMKKDFNAEKLSDEIKEKTNAANVKVSFIYNEQTNLRSQEITEQKDLLKKLELYLKLNDIKHKSSVFDKLQNIQDNLLLDLASPNDAYTLKYISLRGSIGIKDGQKKDEIEINFDKFNSGVVGLTGNCGTGKTTLIENCHPFPCMLTRSGNLKEHFCLKDSHRILIYETPKGKQIKIEMYIDGVAKTTSSKYFVSIKQKGGSWESLKTVDGTLPSYNEFVKNTFGSKEIFLRTSFYPKESVKGMSDLSQAAKTEKMELFSILAGTDYLSAISKKAKDLINQEEIEITNIKSQLKDFDSIDQKIEEYSKSIEDDQKEITRLEDLIKNDNEELAKYEELQKKYIAASATYDLVRTQLNEEKSRNETLERKVLQSKNCIEGLSDQLADIELYKEQLKWIDENSKKRVDLQKEDVELRETYSKEKSIYENKLEEYRSHEDNLKQVDFDITSIKKEISHLVKSIQKTDGVCPVCNAPLSTHKKEEIERENKIIQDSIDSQNVQLISKENDSVKEKEWLKNNKVEDYKSELSFLSKRMTDISNDIQAIDNYMDSIDVEEAKEVVNNVQPKLEAEKNNLKVLQADFNLSTKKVSELTYKLENIPEDYSDKIVRIKRGSSETQELLSTIKASLALSTKELNKLSSLTTTVEDIKSKVKIHQQNIKDYELIQTSFGNNGIQALELDSAAPEISSITNGILNETYGDRFTVSFDTQRVSKDGKRKIDDFIINVYDSDCGRSKRLDLLSSGESVWIKQALHFAFSVIRTRRTGFCFKTRFLDETDGSLDSESRIKYIKMIEAAHCQCNAYQTILITHSQEIKEILEQKIEL